MSEHTTFAPAEGVNAVSFGANPRVTLSPGQTYNTGDAHEIVELNENPHLIVVTSTTAAAKKKRAPRARKAKPAAAAPPAPKPVEGGESA